MCGCVLCMEWLCVRDDVHSMVVCDSMTWLWVKEDVHNIVIVREEII